MTKLPGVGWRRFGAEAIVIIFSVLVALGLDDWRDTAADAHWTTICSSPSGKT